MAFKRELLITRAWHKSLPLKESFRIFTLLDLILNTFNDFTQGTRFQETKSLLLVSAEAKTNSSRARCAYIRVRGGRGDEKINHRPPFPEWQVR